MTKRFIIPFLLFSYIVSCNSNSQNDCSKFHFGRFFSIQAFDQRNIILRNDSIQFETNIKTGHVFKSKIRWLNDCEYELTDFFEKQNDTDSFQQWLPGRTVKTKLLKASSKYCIYESQMSEVSFKIKDTLWVLEN